MVAEFNKVNNDFLQKISNIDILQNFNSGADSTSIIWHLKNNIPDDVFYSDFNLVNDYLSLIKKNKNLDQINFIVHYLNITISLKNMPIKVIFLLNPTYKIYYSQLFPLKYILKGFF